MKKLLIGVAVMAVAMIITGCGSKQESVVKELYSVIQAADRDAADKFAEAHFAATLEKSLNSSEGRNLFGNVKKEFGKIHEAKESPTLKVLKEAEENGVKCVAIEAQCAGTTLYFVVAGEKITMITTKRELVGATD